MKPISSSSYLTDFLPWGNTGQLCLVNWWALITASGLILLKSSNPFPKPCPKADEEVYVLNEGLVD